METKHQRNEHKQASVNDFQHSIWIFWGCQLKISTLRYVDCSQLMSWFDCAINFSWSIWLQSSILQQKISSTKLCKPLLRHLISHSIFSKHCTNLFLLQLCFHLSAVHRLWFLVGWDSLFLGTQASPQAVWRSYDKAAGFHWSDSREYAGGRTQCLLWPSLRVTVSSILFYLQEEIHNVQLTLRRRWIK